jgi:hypothetical protein
MKKIYTLVIAVMAAFVMNAQVNVTFQVDMTDYLKIAGNTLKTVKIAGAFAGLNATSKGTAMGDWKPEESPVFTKVAGSANTWQVVATFPNPAKGQELFYKFLNAATWGTCDVDQECFAGAAAPCNSGAPDNNRVLKIPTTATVVGFKWNTCTSITRVQELPLDAEVSITPNPAQDLAVLTIKGAGTSYNVNVTTVAGQSVQSFDNVSSTVAIEGLNAGLYFVTVRDAAGKSNTQKLIIE